MEVANIVFGEENKKNNQNKQTKKHNKKNKKKKKPTNAGYNRTGAGVTGT